MRHISATWPPICYKKLPQVSIAAQSTFVHCTLICELLCQEMCTKYLTLRLRVCELDRCTSVSACCFDIFHIGSADMNSCFDPIRIRQHHPGSFAAALNTQPERHTETEKEGDSYCFPIALVAMDQRSFHVQRSYLLKDVLWLFCQQINKKNRSVHI